MIPFDDSTDLFVDIQCKQYNVFSLKNQFLNFNHKRDISLFHLNIRSLVSHFDDLVNFLTLLDSPLQLIGISEIWLGSRSNKYKPLPIAEL